LPVPWSLPTQAQRDIIMFETCSLDRLDLRYTSPRMH